MELVHGAPGVAALPPTLSAGALDLRPGRLCLGPGLGPGLGLGLGLRHLLSAVAPLWVFRHPPAIRWVRFSRPMPSDSHSRARTA